MKKTADWIRDRKHLPADLRDFHDQKEVFKSVEAVFGRDEEPYGVNWMSAQCYTIDKFLRFMAYHGYTLQRSRTQTEFYDLQQTIHERRERERKAMADAMGLTPVSSDSSER